MADFSKLEGMSTEMDCESFVELLRELIGQSKYVQNNPRLGVTPKERRTAEPALKALEPFSKKWGGILEVEELEYVDGRTNVKVTYPGTTKKTIGFIGSHLDVVPADPEVWERDPFQLTVEGDKLYGRGTTDCLGHVAMLTEMLCKLAKAKPRLKRSIVVIFIAAEEGAESGVGVDMCLSKGKLAELKNGPVFWVDSADSHPCCGTAGAIQWQLKAKGRLFHSGLPHRGINSIELANEAIRNIQDRFYDDYPQDPREEARGFATGSTMKPTQVACTPGSTNQICPECTLSGDIRLSPFYDVEDVMKAVEGYVADLNESMDDIPTRGAWSKFVLPPEVDAEVKRGSVELTWTTSVSDARLYEGVACSLDSEGHKALVQATREVLGCAKPYSASGSLPLVKSMSKAGFDLQITGFGLMSRYHANNEYCELSGMVKGYEILLRAICLLETTA